MNTKHSVEAASLIFTSALLYWLGFELQGWLFKFTEHVPGVNWFYLPAGLRVLFVLVGGLYGALGISFASIAIDLLHTQELNAGALISTSIASGFGAWVALIFMRFRNLIGTGLIGLTSASLIQYALIYSGLNAVFHQTVWWIFQREGAMFSVDIWPMFAGDFLGAMAFLYGLKVILAFRRSSLEQGHGNS